MALGVKFAPLFAIALVAAGCERNQASPENVTHEEGPPAGSTGTHSAPKMTASDSPLAPPMQVEASVGTEAGLEAASNAPVGLTPDELKGPLNAASDTVRACFKKVEEKPPKSGGAVYLRVVIDPDGRVESARIADAPPTTLRDAAITDCLIATVRTLRFPRAKNGGQTVVPALPFRLSID
jgi:outer membrane biosynthesis protein TonB